MIRHVVLFKFKPETTPEERADLRQRLLDLAHKIEVVRQLEVGENFTVSERASDLCLIADFDDEAGLNIYTDHPEHLPVKALSGALCSETRVADYYL